MSHPFKKLVGVLLLLTLSVATAFACTWDYDTVPEELKGVPDVVDAVVGRLAINPPLYYEVRLKRVVEEMKTHPENLDLYDNAGVAADKLGDTDAAIAWMEKKAEQIKTSKLNAESLKDHQYRYHANLGTFYAHKWAKQKDRTDFNLLKKGIAELETAVKINPDAHFGREIVQIEFLKLFMLKSPQASEFDNMERQDSWKSFVNRVGGEKVSKGLIGMMLLGSGAESPDAMFALGIGSINSYNGSRRSVLSLFVEKRIKELGGQSKMALFDEGGTGISAGIAYYKEDATTAYDELRKNAKEYRKNRDDFMIAKLNKGQHPDTDPSFWNGYQETPRVDLDKFGKVVPLNLRSRGVSNEGFIAALFAIPAAVAAIIFLCIYLKRRAG